MASSTNNELSIVIRARDQASATIRSVEGNMRGLSTSVSNFRRENAAAAGALAGGLVAGVAAAGAAALKSAGDFEQTRIAFNTMLRDGGKASSLLTDISKFAAETPFEFPELATAGKKLLAYGFAQDQVISTMRRLGDVASGLGIPLGELTDIYGKARTQGTLFTEDFDQFTGRGIPLAQALSGVMGVSADKVRGLASEGKITFDVLQKGFAVLTDKGGMFAGGMDAQSKSLNGLLSTVRDNIGSTARALVGIDAGGNIRTGSVFALARDGVAALIPFLASLQPRLIALGNTVAASKTLLLALAGVIGGVLVGALVAVVAALAGPLAIVAAFTAAGAALALGINWLLSTFGGLNAVMQAVQATFGAVTAAVMGLVGFAIAALSGAASGLWQSLSTQLLPALQQLWVLLQPTLLPALRILAAVLGGLLVASLYVAIRAVTFLSQALATVINWYTAVGRTIVSVSMSIANGAGAWKLFRDAALGALSPVVSVVRGLLDLVGRLSVVGNVLSSTKQLGRQLSIPGFASGGFTGRGGTSEIAGVVHRGEYVVPQSQVDQQTGLPMAQGGGGGVTLNVNLGTYAGEPGELRSVASNIYRELMRIDRANGSALLPNIGVRP